MAELDNIDQGSRIARILYLFGSGNRLTPRELATEIIKKFHPENYEYYISKDRIMNNLMKNIRNDKTKIEHSGIRIEEGKRLKMEECEEVQRKEFGPKYKKNQREYWIERDFRLPANFSLGPDSLLTAMILKDNLKIFKNTDFQDKIDRLVDSIDQFANRQKKPLNYDLFENLDTGVSDYSILEHDLRQLIEALTARHICTAKYQKVGSQEPEEREFLPIKFLARDNTLYVLAFDNDKRAYRTYNLARFQPNSVTIRPDIKQNFKMSKLNWEEWRKKSFGIVYDKDVQKVKLEFLPQAVDYTKNRTWHFAPKITFRKNGSMIMEMELGITTELISWIMRWMPNVIVHEPAELKEKVKNRLERSLKNNKW